MREVLSSDALTVFSDARLQCLHDFTEGFSSDAGFQSYPPAMEADLKRIWAVIAGSFWLGWLVGRRKR